MTLAAEFIASSPLEWQKTASRQDAPAQTITGLFADERADLTIGGYMPSTDSAKVFEVDGAAAQAFGLAVRDRLLIDGVTYNVDDLVQEDFGTVIATLRRAV